MLAIHRVGINKQDLARTVEEAKKLFDKSCNICIYRGINIDCDHCPLAAYHEMNVAAIRDNEALKKKENLSNDPIVFELDSHIQLSHNQKIMKEIRAIQTGINNLNSYMEEIK